MTEMDDMARVNRSYFVKRVYASEMQEDTSSKVDQ